MKIVKLITSTTLILCLLLNTNTQAQTNNSMPSNVEDDRCYTEAASPTQFIIKKENILIRQGFNQVINHEAVYDTVTYGVLAHAETKAILAGLNFEVIGNAIKVGSDVKLISTNDEFKIRDEIQDAIVMKWDLSDIGMCDAPSTNDCDLIDWVEIPVEYVPMTQEQGKSMEGNNKLSNSVAYFDIKIKGQNQIIPVEYRFYTKEVLAKAPTQEVLEIPAIYKTVTSQVQVNDNIEMEWVEIVCPAKVDGFLIGQIQLALKGRKYYHGRITGIWTDFVQTALETYQIENSLPIGKLDKNTISSLGLNYEMIVNPNELSALTYISE
jgi:hypothetical protein